MLDGKDADVATKPLPMAVGNLREVHEFVVGAFT
jgi:hypothetical protein